MSDGSLVRRQVAPDEAGERLDKFLATFPEIQSRSRAAKLIEAGRVTLGGRLVKPSHVVVAGDWLEVRLPEPDPKPELKPLALVLDIVFEDKDLIVVNKPAGLVVHPAAGHAADTLVNALIHHAKDLSMGFGELRPGIVHRLDKDTSGLLVIAKNDAAQEALAQQFRARTVRRRYWAVVLGRPRWEMETIVSFLRRHPRDRKRFASWSGPADAEPVGKRAVTHALKLAVHPSGLALVECRLETGRTHQIRVHMSESGHPLVGDALYGATGSRLKTVKSVTVRQKLAELARLGLHAFELGFEHPRTCENLLFRAPWPEDLKVLVEELGFGTIQDR